MNTQRPRYITHHTPEMLERIQKALRSKPLEPEAFERALKRAPDVKERRGDVTGKTTLFIPADAHLRKPFVEPTPREWRHVAIEAVGDKFRLVSFGARMPFLPGARKFYGVADDLATDELTIEQAVANGKRLEALIKLKQ